MLRNKLRIVLGIISLFLIIAIVTEQSVAEQDVIHPFGFNINYQMVSRINTTIPTSTGVFIAQVNSVVGNNRIYYGLEETNVSNYVNGNWSTWDNNTINPFIRITGLDANTTYYYKLQTWVSGVPDNTKPVKSFKTLKPGVYVKPAEAMVSPSGWMNSPDNFRTLNVTVAILNNNGKYIKGLSPEAIIYDRFGNRIKNLTLNGEGPYYNDTTLPDFLNEGGYYINVTGYDSIRGEFSVLRWGCANCHSAGGENYPSTFDPEIVHSEHFDTDDIYVWHYGETPVTSTRQCGGSCHGSTVPNWVPHPSSTTCANCHKSPSGEIPAWTCEKCHADKITGYNATHQRYGEDKHKSQVCNNCHGSLLSINNRPTCITCHPRPGSGLSTVPDVITNKSHSSNKTVDCGLCHNNEHDIKSLALDSNKTCRTCHPGINHAGSYQCTTCHGKDPHDIKIGGGCVGCHGTNYTGANPTVERTFVDIEAFNGSIHQNINNTPPYTVNDNDCTTCHFNKDMERTNIKRCNDCHRRVEQWHGYANITSNLSELSKY